MILREQLEIYGFEKYEVQDILKIVEAYLKEKQKEMFIDTISTMDCELSAVREETFEVLLEDIHK